VIAKTNMTIQERMALRKKTIEEKKDKANEAKAKKIWNDDIKRNGHFTNFAKWKIQTFCNIDCDFIPGIDDGEQPEIKN
jgi:hypothetical protein